VSPSDKLGLESRATGGVWLAENSLQHLFGREGHAIIVFL
jgi:hypothetical protein